MFGSGVVVLVDVVGGNGMVGESAISGILSYGVYHDGDARQIMGGEEGRGVGPDCNAESPVNRGHKVGT